MTSGNQWRAEKAARTGTLTDLNRATSAAYHACRGRHIPSGDTVTRSFPIGQRELPICARCGVPYGKPKGYWGNGNSAARGGAA